MFYTINSIGEGRKNKKNRKENSLKKKIRISIIVVVVVALLVWAIPAIAAYVGSLTVQTTVREPISIEGLTEVPVEIDPGQSFSFGGEVHNDSSSVEYGMLYYGYLWLITPLGEKIEISLEEDGELWLNDTKGGPQYLGTIAIYVDGEAYTPGTLKNLAPGATHEIKARVKTSEGMNPGCLMATIGVERRAPQ